MVGKKMKITSVILDIIVAVIWFVAAGIGIASWIMNQPISHFSYISAAVICGLSFIGHIFKDLNY